MTCGVRFPTLRGMKKLLHPHALLATLFLLAGPGAAHATGHAESLVPTGGEAVAGAARTVTDALGRELRIDVPPERIVTAGRAVLMIADVLYAFPGVPERLVGIGRIRQGRGSFVAELDPAFAEKTILERNVGPEQIAALQPGLVILKTFMREPLGRQLEDLGIPVFYVELETPEQYQRDILALGRVLGEDERASDIAAFYSEHTTRIETRTTQIPARRKPETLLLYARRSDADTAFQVPPDTWIQTRMVELAGGTPVWRGSNPGGGWATVSFEQIAAWDPQHIMIIAYDGSAPEIRDRLLEDARWQELQAVGRGRLHAFPMDFYSWDQPDTRWILGLEWLAARLQPELFNDRDMDSLMREFFSQLYGLTYAGFDRIIAPTLAGDID